MPSRLCGKTQFIFFSTHTASDFASWPHMEVLIEKVSGTQQECIKIMFLITDLAPSVRHFLLELLTLLVSVLMV